MGSRLRAARQTAALSQADVAYGAGLSERSLRCIECGVRRTRLSTVRHIVTALHLDDAADDSVLLGELLSLAGPALAPESVHADRIERRRARRTRAAAERFVTEHVVTYEEVPGGVLETHVHRTRRSRSGVKERRYQVLRSDTGNGIDFQHS